MTLLQIKTAAAAYHNVTVDQLTSNGIDLGLMALNQAKHQAELDHDFNFQRQMLTLPVTGGVLSNAVLQGTQTAAEVKLVLDVGVIDQYGNFHPVEWTTAEESQERQRQENRYREPCYRYPTDAQYHSEWQNGESRVIIRGDNFSWWPPRVPPTSSSNLLLGVDAYVFDADWTDLSTEDVWTKHASKYLLWATVIDLNKIFKSFVPRQEGNLTEPADLMMAGLQSFIDWDVFKYEQGRRHGR